MNKNYISLLRGINVSGKKKLKMADLKALYEGLGFEDVTTYIQSGNVLFNSNEANPAELSKIIEGAIAKTFGFVVPVDVRTSEEYKAIIESCPYPEANDNENGAKVLVSFLSQAPSSESFEKLAEYAKSPERIEAVNNVIYLFCPNGYGKSKLSNNFIESKLKLVATTRNWKTVRKLAELSG